MALTQIPTKAIWPYVQQWNLNVQKELPGNIVASVAYVGSKGTHLTLQSNANQLFPVAAANNPFPAGTPIDPDGCGLRELRTERVRTTRGRRPWATARPFQPRLSPICGSLAVTTRIRFAQTSRA